MPRSVTPSTLSLLHRLLAMDPNGSHWAEHLGVSRAAVSIARVRGRLSPTMAGTAADLLGENPEPWIALAALEAEPETRARNKLIRALATKLNS